MAGRVVGRGGAALLRHGLDKGRALPWAWRVRQGPQGPVPAALHSALVALRRACLPEGTQGVWLGEGACEGTTLPETRNEAGWLYACRTAQRPVATWEGEPCRLATCGAGSQPGPRIALQEGKLTRAADGPVMVRSWWAKGYQEPLERVRNMDAAAEACRSDQKRCRIETLFSDQKSRGFHLPKSQISDPQRLARL
jgi:hypothetical protein